MTTSENAKQNPNWNKRFHGQRPEGTCRHCGELIWANTDAKARCLAGECNPALDKDAATQAIANLLSSNFEAGLIDEATYKAALAGLGR